MPHAASVNEAGVDVFNAIIDQVAAEFDGRVITVDTSPLNRDASMFDNDKLHPSTKGHAAIAALCTSAIVRQATFEPAFGAKLERRVSFDSVVPTGTQTFYLAGDIVWNTAPATGRFVGWVCTVEGRPGTWKTFGAITA